MANPKLEKLDNETEARITPRHMNPAPSGDHVSPPPLPVKPPAKLPSGRVVNVIRTGPMVFTSNLPTAWVLLYETKHPWSEKKEIIAEVEDIWKSFRLEVEKRQMKMGIIKVTDPAKGTTVQERTEINFVFEPTPEGGWKMELPDLMKEKKKGAQQQNGPANGSQSFRSETNSTSSAAGSRR